MEANAWAGADTIELPADTYRLTIPGRDEDEGATGDLDPKGELTIEGAGEASTIIDGGGVDRVFETLGGDDVLTISDLTIRNGHSVNPNNSVACGGAIGSVRSQTTDPLLASSPPTMQGRTARDVPAMRLN